MLKCRRSVVNMNTYFMRIPERLSKESLDLKLIFKFWAIDVHQCTNYLLILAIFIQTIKSKLLLWKIVLFYCDLNEVPKTRLELLLMQIRLMGLFWEYFQYINSRFPLTGAVGSSSCISLYNNFITEQLPWKRTKHFHGVQYNITNTNTKQQNDKQKCNSMYNISQQK